MYSTSKNASSQVPNCQLLSPHRPTFVLILEFSSLTTKQELTVIYFIAFPSLFFYMQCSAAEYRVTTQKIHFQFIFLALQKIASQC